ncbi:MAG: hypothetical protein KC933_40490 [Myxococcales bacterium]|nr:hypothetical protein [Myxococcales bacterium]
MDTRHTTPLARDFARALGQAARYAQARPQREDRPARRPRLATVLYAEDHPKQSPAQLAARLREMSVDRNGDPCTVWCDTHATASAIRRILAEQALTCRDQDALTMEYRGTTSDGLPWCAEVYEHREESR